MLVATIVSMFGLFGSQEADEESWKLAAVEVFAVFFIMRLLQFLLGIGLARGENRSRTFVCVTVTLFVLIYLIC